MDIHARIITHPLARLWRLALVLVGLKRPRCRVPGSGRRIGSH